MCAVRTRVCLRVWGCASPAPQCPSVTTRLGTSVGHLRHDPMEQGPTEPHAGRGMLLLSSGGAGGGYFRVAFDTGPIATEHQFPCWTLVACRVSTQRPSKPQHKSAAAPRTYEHLLKRRVAYRTGNNSRQSRTPPGKSPVRGRMALRPSARAACTLPCGWRGCCRGPVCPWRHNRNKPTDSGAGRQQVTGRAASAPLDRATTVEASGCSTSPPSHPPCLE